MPFYPNHRCRLAAVLFFSLFIASAAEAQSASSTAGATAAKTVTANCGDGKDEHAAEIARAEGQCTGTGVVSTALLEGGVLFKTNSDQLSELGVKAVGKLINDLGDYQKILSVKVIGHTDNRGSEQYNQLLSERRAQYIASYFAAAFPNKRVTSVGLGEAVPLVSNDTPAGRKVNRRVEIQIIANNPR